MNNKKELKKMIQKYLAGNATPEQVEFLEAYFKHFDSREDVTEQFSDKGRSQLRDEIEGNILEKISLNDRPKVRRLPLMLKVAASVLILFSVAGYWFLNRGPVITGQDKVALQSKTGIIKPGGNKAVLTLGDGSKISLNDADLGEIGRQGEVVVTKAENGLLTYDLSAITAKVDAPVSTNTIETPRGGEYQVILPDGTKVWLNAASKLSFPTAFKGKERRVELVGEAYFEVAKNKAMPFRVASNGQTVEVLGTHFNVSAYADDEAVKTTLLEGSVKVASAKNAQILVPGQQSTIGRSGSIAIANVDLNEAIGWKNGLFVFSNENIASLMRKVSRWYDVDIDYKGSLTKEGFVGSVSRFKNINELLSTLELTGMVHFKVEGRRVTVMP